MLTIRTILHPTDFSPQSMHAFHLACSLARDHDGRVIVLHVQERPAGLYTAGVAMAPPPPALKEEAWHELQQQLQRLQASEADVTTEHITVMGDPAAAILEAAATHNCDMIVMGTHGRGGLGRLLMGSVAESVLRQAPCPVLTVKTPAEANAGTAPFSEDLASAMRTPQA